MCETYSKASLGHNILSSSSTQSEEDAVTTDNPKAKLQTTQHSQVS